jgi:large subunit ribosomal protein L1
VQGKEESMKKSGKHVENARKKVEARPYKLAEATELIKKTHHTKFNETVELALNLGVDPKHSDQVVRGTVVLPHGLGKAVRVLVLAGGDKVREAQEAGADFVGGDEMVQKIMEGWTDYDAVIATPDMMKSAGRLGKVLGPRGLMPNPKTGTVTADVTKAIRETKAGKVEFRVDKAGIVHCPIGKIQFDATKLAENAHALIGAVLKAKPAAAKGKYVKKITLTSTMGPGILIDLAEAEILAAAA